MTSPHQVRAFGLNIWSDIDLPEFEPSTGLADVTVILERERATTGPPSPRWTFATDTAECRIEHVGRFSIAAGREIRVTPAPGVDAAFLRLYVEGMMLAVLLHQRNYFVLHASVVSVNGRGIAFLGPIGAGKSSLAKALHSLGHVVVADDNAAISIQSGVPVVLPAFPRIKLYPDIAAALGMNREVLEDLHSSQIKKTTSVENRFAAGPVVLDRIYALSAEVPDIEKLSRSEAVVELVKHSIPTRWGMPGTGEQLRRCGVFSGLVPIYRVRTFDSLTSLPVRARALEQHIGHND
jgi:hypothetical protein